MSQINNYLRCVGRVARMHEALVVWLNLAKLFRFFPPLPPLLAFGWDLVIPDLRLWGDCGRVGFV